MSIGSAIGYATGAAIGSVIGGGTGGGVAVTGLTTDTLVLIGTDLLEQITTD